MSYSISLMGMLIPEMSVSEIEALNSSASRNVIWTSLPGSGLADGYTVEEIDSSLSGLTPPYMGGLQKYLNIPGIRILAQGMDTSSGSFEVVNG